MEVPLKCVKFVNEAINELGQKSTIRVEILEPKVIGSVRTPGGLPAAASSSSSSRTSLIIRVTLVRHERYECTKIWGNTLSA